jgi:hypothetical protein
MFLSPLMDQQKSEWLIAGFRYPADHRMRTGLKHLAATAGETEQAERWRVMVQWKF